MIGKQGILGDVLDLSYLIAGAIIILVVASLALTSGINDSNHKSLVELGDFKRVDSAIANIKVLTAGGEQIDPSQVEDLIKRSKVFAGRTITSCFDYRNEEDCNTNPVRVGSSKAGIYACRWHDGLCLAPV